jgi:myo-inositol-1(or 4)-monophosphatase
MSNLDELLTIAQSTAVYVGRVLSERQATWAHAERSSDHDIKLVGDRGAEAIAVAQLMRGTDISVFSEEAGLIGPSGGELLWVLDPLDGSANYARDVPLCCVSIALCRGQEPLLGVIYDFNRDEMFSGIVGVGAHLNGTAIAVSSVAQKSRAILATGFPAALDYGTGVLDGYIRAAQEFHKVRSLGTAALMLAYVAAGRFDVYREHNVRFWDVAAGMALVRAAGGSIDCQVDSAQLDARVRLCAHNGRLPVE